MRVFLLSLLALTVFGSVDYAVLRANHYARVTEATQKLQAMHDEVKASIGSFKPFELQSTTDDEHYCNTSKLTFWAVWSNNNCSVVGEVWDPATNETRMSQVYQSYCVATDADGYTCKAKVDWAFEQYRTNCSKTPNLVNTTQLEQQRSLLALSSIVCLTDDTDHHLCANDLKALQTMGQNWTQTILDHVCTPCIRKVFLAFEIFAPKSYLQVSSYLNLICFKLNNDYCSLKFLGAIGGVGPIAAAGPSDDQLHLICQPCIPAFVSRHLTTVAAFGGSLDSLVEESKFLKLIRVMCITNLAGDYCYTKLTDTEANATFTALSLACLPDLVTKTCGSKCHTQIQNANAKFGCCFGTWFNLLEWQYVAKPAEYKLPYAPDVIENFVNINCALPIPVGCASEKVAISIVLKNIAWQWYLDHKAASDSDLRAYVMWLLGLEGDSVSNVTVTQVGGTTVSGSAHSAKYQLLAASDSGLQISTVVSPPTQNDVATVTTNAQSAPSQSNPIAAGWELSARSDQSQGISAASADAKPVGGGAFATNTPAYYLATFIVAIVSLLLL